MPSENSLLAISTLNDPVDDIGPMLVLANSLDAHLDILVLGLAITPILVDAIPVDWNSIHDKLENDVEKRVSDIKRLADQSDVSVTVSSRSVTDTQFDACVSHEALYRDLTLIPHCLGRQSTEQNQLFKSVLFHAMQAVLVLGDQAHPLERLCRVLVAWDDVPQAAHALHYALPFLGTNDQMHVTVVNTGNKELNRTVDTLLAPCLKRRGINVKVDRIAVNGEVADALIRHADDIDADLIVMGAYGHSRLREWMLGGTTRFVLRDIKRPVLMAH